MRERSYQSSHSPFYYYITTHSLAVYPIVTHSDRRSVEQPLRLDAEI
jgi:hypothetical protein